MADLSTLQKFQALSPFEIKNELINLAKKTTKTTNPRSSMPAAATPTGSPPRRAKASFFWVSSPSPRANA